ncbi:MAG TPA: hypothetical protein VJV39_07380 [Dongiaceae bacterium]|nr:hypothetical protein [Dongiaceae bacterium]
MNTWTHVRHGWIALVILLVSNETYAGATEEALLIVDGAQNLFRTPQSPVARQISYTVELEYPGRAVGEPQWDQLIETGWVRCRSANPDQKAANDDWDDFEDASVTPGRTIHQHLTNWLRDDQMTTIRLRYYSGLQNGYPVTRPDGTEQHVDLIFHHSHGREGAEWLQLDCSK